MTAARETGGNLPEIHFSSYRRWVPRWCFQSFFNVHPRLGKMSILTNIFQLG